MNRKEYYKLWALETLKFMAPILALGLFCYGCFWFGYFLGKHPHWSVPVLGTAAIVASIAVCKPRN